MKLRFDQQSLRLRVRKSDLEKLEQQGFIEEIVAFPNDSFTYRVHSGGDEISVSFSGGILAVSVPAALLRNWIDSEEVGIYAALKTVHPETTLQVILEKDFPCQHGSTAENADTFGELAEKSKKQGI